jgi:hypothetical protein
MKHININKQKFEEIYSQKCPGQKYVPTIIPAVSRIIVLGDVHGDYKMFIKTLKLCNIIDDNLKWIGKNTYVVQIGDQIDSYRNGPYPFDHPKMIENDQISDIKIMKLCNDLHEQASHEGGMFISLLGNHEIMNNQGDMRYVSYKNIEDFNEYKDPKNKNLKFKSGLEARKHSFLPGNEYGVMMGCSRMACVIIGSHLFVHAGIINDVIEEIGISSVDDLETINMAIQMWLFGLIKDKHAKYIHKILNAKNSMFWARILGEIEPDIKLNDPKCMNYISKTLETFKIGDIIIGHTPQSIKNRDTNSTCDRKIWRVDNGSSYAFDNMGKRNDTEFYIIEEKGKKKV